MTGFMCTSPGDFNSEDTDLATSVFLELSGLSDRCYILQIVLPLLSPLPRALPLEYSFSRL